MAPTPLGPDATADQVLDGLDLRGRTALVTGASGGLGLETARALAAHGAEVVLAARPGEKLERASAGLRAQLPGAAVHALALDLSDLDAVRAAAAEALARFPRLQLLVDNAGIMACPLQRTAQGFESQFGVNHLGHFLFTCLLAPALLAAAPARVVVLSSGGHKYAAVDFDDPNFERRPYDKWLAYGQSKTANALFAVGLERRLGGRGVHAFAVHPGAIATDLGRHLTRADIAQMSQGAAGGRLAFKSIPAGAATAVWAATSPSLEGRGGLYLEDCGIARPAAGEGDAGGYLPYALDAEAAERLWALSERAVGQQFRFLD